MARTPHPARAFAALACLTTLAGCGGSAPPAAVVTPPPAPPPAAVTGIATPSAVAVVTAKNAG